MVFAVINRSIHWMVIGIMSPIGVLLILSKGISLAQSGIIFSLMSLAVVLCELPSGILSDRIGRKRVYLIAQLLYLLGFLVLLFTDSILLVMAAFSLVGIARAFASGSIEADFIDNYLHKYGKDRLHTLMMGMGIGETLGLALGALVGGILPGISQGILPGQNRFSLNIIAQIVLTVVLIGMAVSFRETKDTGKHVPIREFLNASYMTIRHILLLRLLLVGMFIWGFTFFTVEIYWQPRLQGLLIDGDNTQIFGYLNSGYFLLAVAGSLIAGKVLSSAKVHAIITIVIMRLIVGAVLIILALQSRVLSFSVFYLLIMGANGMLNIPEGTLLNNTIPDDKRSSMLSLASLIMQLGGIVSSMIFSLFVARIGIPTVWMIAGAVFSLSSLIYLAYHRRQQQIGTA